MTMVVVHLRTETPRAVQIPASTGWQQDKSGALSVARAGNKNPILFAAGAWAYVQVDE